MDLPARHERWPGVFHRELPAIGLTLIDRVLCFRQFLRRWLKQTRFQAIHFRSIYEGMEIVRAAQGAKLIFEVNGLPSIELKYHYPKIVDNRELLWKLAGQEQVCLEAADMIVTPSAVTAHYLADTRGVPAYKIRHIPNGVDIELFHPPPAPRLKDNGIRLLYFGTLTPWQGVPVAVRAFAQLRQRIPATLAIIGSAERETRDGMRELADKLNVGEHVQMIPPVSRAELRDHIHQADVVLAPLTLNDRNTVQGCCPLKVLESMASGTPLIASDLPVVREVGCDQVHFLLVKPGSVDQLVTAALRLAEDPELASKLAAAARAQVEARFTWDRSGAALLAVYEELGINRSITV